MNCWPLLRVRTLPSPPATISATPGSLLRDPPAPPRDSLRTQIWYAKSPVVGTGHTITMGLSAAEPLTMSIIVGQGSNISAPFDAASTIGTDNGTQSAVVVSPSVTTSDINDLLVGFTQFSSGATVLAGVGFHGTRPRLLPPSSTPNTGLRCDPGELRRKAFSASPQTWISAVVAVANNPTQATLSWTPSAEIGGNADRRNHQQLPDRTLPGHRDAPLSPKSPRPQPLTFTDATLTASRKLQLTGFAPRTQLNALGPYSSVVTIRRRVRFPRRLEILRRPPASTTGRSISAWTASTETGGTISKYLGSTVPGGLSCTNFAQIGTRSRPARPHTMTQRADRVARAYSYRVQASDTANNLGALLYCSYRHGGRRRNRQQRRVV